jgi:hypothetical protein
MANVVYCKNSNLCKNIFYYALATEFVPNPPPTLPAHHTGIADSGSKWSLLCARCPSRQLQPPGPNRWSLLGQQSPRMLGGQRHPCICNHSTSSSLLWGMSCLTVGGICSFARIRPCFHDSVDRVRPTELMSWSNTFLLL